MANSTKVWIDKMTDLKFKFDRIPKTYYKMTVFVMTDSPFDIIIGTEFTKRANIMIDFAKASIKVDGHEIYYQDEERIKAIFRPPPPN
ncbi:hypothetical protein ENBRE01_1743 [Enteropsectra breve]|nr:hypothetical protein ENBRE01_1743 [Enteropsectra breve]